MENNCGWKIIVAKNYGRALVLNELNNNLGGSFYYLFEGASVFHLWWKSEYKDINKMWYPHIKIEYQTGGVGIDAPEPNDFANASKIDAVIYQRTSSIKMKNLNVNGLILADEIRVEDIATTNLNIEGNIAANQITVKANGNTADFVFSDTYQLQDLTEVETYIKTHKHLPDIPSAEEMEASGVNLAEMNKLLLQKVEELTLYSIVQKEELEKEQDKRKDLEDKIGSLQDELNTIKEIITNHFK